GVGHGRSREVVRIARSGTAGSASESARRTQTGVGGSMAVGEREQYGADREVHRGSAVSVGGPSLVRLGSSGCRQVVKSHGSGIIHRLKYTPSQWLHIQQAR